MSGLSESCGWSIDGQRLTSRTVPAVCGLRGYHDPYADPAQLFSQPSPPLSISLICLPVASLHHVW